MATAEQPALIDDRQEITRLIARARANGQPDTFFGKRRWPRYQWGMQLEVNSGDCDPADR